MSEKTETVAEALERLLTDVRAHETFESEAAEFRNAAGSWEDLEDRILEVQSLLFGKVVVDTDTLEPLADWAGRALERADASYDTDRMLAGSAAVGVAQALLESPEAAQEAAQPSLKPGDIVADNLGRHYAVDKVEGEQISLHDVATKQTYIVADSDVTLVPGLTERV